jgi:putative cell wall-binding protein
MGMAATPSPPAPVAPIRLLAATFVPARGEAPDIPPGLTVAGYAPGQMGYYIVQFAGPVRPEWKSAVEAVGAELIDYLPDHAFKARMTPEQAAVVEAQPSVAWLGLFHPAYKISPRVDRDRPVLLRVRIEEGGDVGKAVAGVEESGAVTLRREGNLMLIMAAPGQAAAIARVLDVAWIEPFAFPVTHNDQAGGVIMGGSIANTRGYDGSTQIVAVADTGIGDGTAAGAHPDIPSGRVVAIYSWTSPNSPGCYNVQPDGARDVDSGHGTHTAVSVLGDGGLGGRGMGTAPAAGLVFQAVEEYLDLFGGCGAFPDGYYLVGLPLDLHDLYQQAYGDEANFHSNSWGTSDTAGDYTTDSKNTDDFVFDNPGFLVTFSAGNDGVDADEDGVVDPGSLGSPATAKNVLAVGASEGLRPDDWPCDTGLTYANDDPYQAGTCSAMGGVNSLGTAGSRWGFAAEPLLSDVTAGDAEQMAPFSSRGPTDDMRIRPDVVAPGTWILSGYSGQYREGYGTTVNPVNLLYQWDGWGIPFDQDYKYMGGTSMSNPLAAGAAAVAADFYQKAHLHAASAALVKATLINSARDLLDENNDGLDDNDFPIPNIHEGWGIIDLDGATDGSHQYVDHIVGIGTSDSVSYQYTVDTGGSEFKATLVWSDHPSAEIALANLVNDLDLEVTAPDGTTVYAGNNFVGGWSEPSMTPDQVNNVENVFVASAAAGPWTVTVHGSNVPMGPQPFALVVDGDLTPPPVDVTPPVFSGVPDDVTVEATGPSGAIVTYTPPTATDLVDGTVAVNCLPASGSIFALGTATVTCTATDTSANQATATFDVTVHQPLGVVRYAGANRYETARAISQGEFSDPDSVDIVFVAFGGNFPDALAGAAAAGRLGAPLLLVQADAIPPPTAAELIRLGPNTIVVLGGTAVISPAVETGLGSFADTVIRLAGPNRYATAVQISLYGFPDPGSAGTVIVATGLGFADALAGAPAAVELGGPVLLTDPNLLPGAVAAEIERLGPSRIIVVGGTSVVSNTVFSQLQALAPDVDRVSGPNRYETAVAISAEAFPSDAERVYLATGLNFPDALAGAAAAGWWSGPVLLVPGDELPVSVSGEIESLGATRGIILGGTAVVGADVENGLVALIA